MASTPSLARREMTSAPGGAPPIDAQVKRGTVAKCLKQVRQVHADTVAQQRQGPAGHICGEIGHRAHRHLRIAQTCRGMRRTGEKPLRINPLQSQHTKDQRPPALAAAKCRATAARARNTS